MTVVKQKVELQKPTYVKYSEAKPGQTLVVGTFLGTKMVKPYKPTNKDGSVNPDVPSHSFETDEGEVRLNSATSLNRLLAQIEPGTPVDITFLGKEKKKSKDGDVYSENTFEVSILVEQ